LAKEKKQAEQKEKKPGETPMEFTASMASVLVTGLFIITFIFQAFEIPSKSMVETLLVGDHVFVDRVTFAPKTSWVGPLVPYREVRRGDIVVFLSPSQAGLYVVKRIRGVPGDRLRLHGGRLYINGELQDETAFVNPIRSGIHDPSRDDFPDMVPPTATPEWRLQAPLYVKNGELVVPPERYFAMGDNRDISYDSRYWGFIPRENIIGRPMFIYWSFETPENQYEKTSIAERISFIGRVIVHFFDDTRWRRMLKIVR
jgi:signal peptidase I